VHTSQPSKADPLGALSFLCIHDCVLDSTVLRCPGPCPSLCPSLCQAVAMAQGGPKSTAAQPSDAGNPGAIVCAHGGLAPEKASGAKRALVCSAAWAYFARVAKEAAEMGSEREGEGGG